MGGGWKCPATWILGKCLFILLEITMFINQMRSWENLKVDELVKLSRLFQSDTLKNLNTRPVGVGTHELRLNKSYFKTITALFTMNRIILSKHRFKDDLKGQISVTRRFLSYFKSRSII